MKLWQKHAQQAGDTLVEVLIAVAVISSVLAGAFLVAQKSAIGVRDSQEHGEVTQLLQGQIELVRSLALAATSTSDPLYATSPKYFCIDGSNPLTPIRINSAAIPDPLPALQSDDFSKYDAKCNDIQGHYNIAGSYDSASNLFTFVGRWDHLGGGRNQEQLSYRISPGTAVVTPPSLPIGNIANVVKQGCTPDPLTGVCAAPDPPPRYRWTMFYKNTSNNPGNPPTGCSWQWSDGTTNSNVSCGFGNTVQHTWATEPTIPPYPAGCASYPKTVLLTVVLTSGPNATKLYKTNVPDCY